MNAVEICEKRKSRELITSFNKSEIWISYDSMKKHRNDLAKLAIYQSLNFGVPLPSHFSPDMFTIAAFDNFDHSDKNNFWKVKYTRHCDDIVPRNSFTACLTSI